MKNKRFKIWEKHGKLNLECMVNLVSPFPFLLEHLSFLCETEGLPEFKLWTPIKWFRMNLIKEFLIGLWSSQNYWNRQFEKKGNLSLCKKLNILYGQMDTKMPYFWQLLVSRQDWRMPWLSSEYSEGAISSNYGRAWSGLLWILVAGIQIIVTDSFLI